MKRLCFLFYFILIKTCFVFAQKNSFEIGAATYNHFDGYSFKVSQAVKNYPYAIVGLIAESFCYSYERQISNKNYLAISYTGFTYEYQSDQKPRIRGIYTRDFWNLGLLYRRQWASVWSDRINIGSSLGVHYRRGSEVFFLHYIIIDGVNPQKKSAELGIDFNDLGISTNLNTEVKIYKGLFADAQVMFTNYLIGKELKEDYGGGVKKNNKVLSFTLSLGYKF